MTSSPSDLHACLRYWDLSDNIRLDDAVALWCGFQPDQLQQIRGITTCMRAKRSALVHALRDGRLDYEDLGVSAPNGKTYYDQPVDELIEKDRLVIKKASLRRWFEQVSATERPPFLFDESRQIDLPDGSDAAEVSHLKGVGMMALVLAKTQPAYRIGPDDRPNAKQIGAAVLATAKELFGPDVVGFNTFERKVAQALKLLEQETPANRR